jgi:EpsI family protein
MIARRDLLIGSACVVTAGAAVALKPKRRVSLLGRSKLADVVPSAFGAWTSRDVGDLVAPKTEGSLASRLYGETVGRVYRQAGTGIEVMMLLAHGDTQTDQLQLHRPESCYPAFGFQLTSNRPASVPLAGGEQLPTRRIVANGPDRIENIVYWSRIGEFLPNSGPQQRLDQLKTAMQGIVADGLLARFSVLGASPDDAFTALDGFIPTLIMAVRPGDRPALIGTLLARGAGASA